MIPSWWGEFSSKSRFGFCSNIRLGVAPLSTASGGFVGGLKIGCMLIGNVPSPTKPCGHCFTTLSCSCVCVLTVGLVSWLVLSGVLSILGVIFCGTGFPVVFAQWGHLQFLLLFVSLSVP